MTRSIDDLFAGFDWSQDNVHTFSNYGDAFEPANVLSLEKMRELMDSIEPVKKQTLYVNPNDLDTLRKLDRLAYGLECVGERSLFADMYGGVPVVALPAGFDSFAIDWGKSPIDLTAFKREILQNPYLPFEWNCRCAAVPITSNPLDDIPSANGFALTMTIVGISIAWGLYLWFAMAGGL